MARGKGKRTGQLLSRQGRAGGESTSVESSSRFSEDSQFPVPSGAGTITRKKGKNRSAKLYGSGDFSREGDRDGHKPGESSSTADDNAVEIDTAAGKPDLEAYCRGSWWDVEIVKKGQGKYLVHYEKFPDSENEWLPLTHLRMRCRTSTLSDCCEIHAGIDVCVMTRHKHSDEKSAAWYDAKVIDIERRPHTPKSCKCSFKIALYSIPASLPRDCRDRTLLPVSQNTVSWKNLSIMREARSLSFEAIVAASLPNVVNSPKIWAKDGTRWFSSFDYSGPSWEPSPSFESRVAGGGIGPSLSRGHREEHTPILVPELKSFASFLEEEDIVDDPPALRSDDSDADLIIISVVPGSKAQPIDSGSKMQPIASASKAQPIDSASKAQPIDSGSEAQLTDFACKAQPIQPACTAQPIESGSKVQSMDPASKAQPMDLCSKPQSMDPGSKARPIDLDVDVVAVCENDDMDVVTISDDDDMGYDLKRLDRYSSDDKYDERETSPGRPEGVVETPNPTTSSDSLENPQEELDEVVLSDVRPLEPTDEIPSNPVSVASGVSTPLPSVDTGLSISVPDPAVERATTSENSDDDDFAQLLEECIAGDDICPTVEPAECSEDSDDDFAAYLETHIARNCGPKRIMTENHGANPGAKRRRVNLPITGRSSFKPPSVTNFKRPSVTNFKRPSVTNFKSPSVSNLRGKEMSRPKFPSSQSAEQVHTKKAAKEQARVHENRELVAVTLGSSPANDGSNLDGSEAVGLEKFRFRDAEMMLDPESPAVAAILARSRDASKTGLATQPSLLKEKRTKKVGNAAVPKKVGNAAVPKKVAKEITYAELFKTVEPVQCIIPSEMGPAEESGLLPSWDPFRESLRSEALLKVEEDPHADLWKDMRRALESGNEGNGVVGEQVEESDTNSRGESEYSGDSECLEHVVDFDPVLGEVCGVCGLVLLGIQDIWTTDNAKRIVTAKEGSDDSDEDMYGPEYGFAPWDSDDGKPLQQNSVGEGSNIELIPELATRMQRHQKQGFHFLWRNLAGQDCNGKPCFPHVEPGGCVLAHAPGTGKTFLIISFLQSYMKRYPDCRPLIVAPKIMLQPWEREFRKWNVEIPVHNFNQAFEQGKRIFQKHQEAGVVQYVRQKNTLNVHREAMLWEWLKTPSVLVISYQMFTMMTLRPDSALSTIKSNLLDKPSIVVLDEGHNARNHQSQIGRQLMAIKTPLRILLSGTLFQNNFEELYTCLNLARSGFVNTFAKVAGLKSNVQQEVECQSDDESERSTAEWKERAAKAAEAQAKKLFGEEIGNRIDKGQLASSTPEYAQGLERLRRLTTPFVDHYAGGVLRDLPPLRDFTIVLQPAALQEKMIKNVSNRMQDKTMLEREGLMSFVCIHPCLLSRHNVGKTFTDLLSPEEMDQAATDDPAVGVKTRFIMNLLEELQNGRREEKMLIFCQHIYPLSLLEKMLKTKFGWIREREILHIDGKVTPDERQKIIERFNDPHGKIRVLTLSTKACGEGITLTGASRVVFMDVLWNPAVLRQAIHRAFRLGQTKVVHVYRLVVTDCMEEEKYKKMVLKDLKSQTIFCASDENHESAGKGNGEVCGPPQHDFWEVKKLSSKDPVLNELERQDAALDEPAFRHIFRHGGLFDDEYKDDLEGKGANATEWLRDQKADVLDSYDIDGENGDFSDNEDGDNEGGTFGSYDTETEYNSGDDDNDAL
ncbi:hypothetical protein M758_5G115600 [Ceratodon purpureus]|nr:hypothetical protein M758_5G115600 [Ceratodon purpureus]